jgi:hypothetical protein
MQHGAVCCLRKRGRTLQLVRRTLEQENISAVLCDGSGAEQALALDTFQSSDKAGCPARQLIARKWS